jgi:hypothetical protein
VNICHKFAISVFLSVSLSVSVSASMSLSVSVSISIRRYDYLIICVRHVNCHGNSKGLYELGQNLKGPLTMAENQLKFSAHPPLRETYRRITLSAKSISLDTPFKRHRLRTGQFYPTPPPKKREEIQHYWRAFVSCLLAVTPTTRPLSATPAISQITIYSKI